MKRKLTWLAGMLCAALALGLVFWLRADGERKGGVAVAGNSPRVTKPYPRERDERERHTKNSREEFEAARKRGLTEEEVRGIVEKFVRAGIGKIHWSNTSEKELLDNRKAENSWYLQTLVEGLGLTLDQQRETAEKLHKLRVYDFSVYLTKMAVAASSIDEQELLQDDAIKDADPFAADPSHWIDSLGFRPWDLCELDQGQKEMIGLRMEGEEWLMPRAGSATLDFGIKEKYEDLDDPFEEHHIAVTAAGYIFPLNMYQVDRILAAKRINDISENEEDGNHDLLENVMVLTSAQLRTLLLTQPSMAERLLKQLGE